jgi:hypothetical protein
MRFFTPASTLMAVLAAARDCLRARAALQIEVLAVRHQLNILQRSVKRPKLALSLSESFTGTARIDPLRAPDPAQVQSDVAFETGARTTWLKAVWSKNPICKFKDDHERTRWTLPWKVTPRYITKKSTR